MAVNINMGKAKTAAKPVAAQEAETKFDPEVDELAALEAWAAKQKKDPKAVRLAELKKKFAERVAAEFDDEPEKEDIVYEGEKNRLKFGKRAVTREVTPEGKEKFANKVGEEAFLEVAQVPLGAIDKYIPKIEQGDYLVTGWGSRTSKIEAKLVEKK